MKHGKKLVVCVFYCFLFPASCLTDETTSIMQQHDSQSIDSFSDNASILSDVVSSDSGCGVGMYQLQAHRVDIPHKCFNAKPEFLMCRPKTTPTQSISCSVRLSDSVMYWFGVGADVLEAEWRPCSKEELDSINFPRTMSCPLDAGQ